MDIDGQNIRRMSQLDRLPWFDNKEDGHLRLSPQSGVPQILDVHAHIGWSYGFAKNIDHSERPPLRYFYDYESAQDILNEEKHPWPAERPIIGRDMWLAPFVLGQFSATHTAANLSIEMNRFNYAKACLLPIEGPILSHHAADTLAASKLDSRFIPFAAVHPYPWGTEKVRLLRAQLDQGALAVKFHPEFQFIAPDNPHAMKLFAWCESHGVPVLVHTGYTGAEPAWMRAKAEAKRFEPMLTQFPKLRVLLAHTGLSCWESIAELAKKHEDHAWVDISGQPVPVIKEIIKRLNRNRICYGSDWPFYPLIVALARTLAATQDIPGLWPDLFYNNAARFLGISNL
jgi:predicted TIM-barrel fold metal-dependent hydrolase